MARILLVEDNELNRDMLGRRLSRLGYDVTVACDGEEAVRLTLSMRPELVLMDLDLPVLNGWAATKLLKANPAVQHIPVIALTAHAMASDRDIALAAGCDEYETKPVDIHRLVGKICRLLSSAPTETVRPAA